MRGEELLSYEGCAWEVSGPKLVLLSSCFMGGVGEWSIVGTDAV